MHQSPSSSALQNPDEDLYHFDRKFRFFDDHLVTITSIEQKRVEELVEECYKAYLDKGDIEPLHPNLFRDEHVSYLMKGLIHLPRSYESLDASRPWIAYWILHSLELLAEPIPEEVCQKVISFLSTCQCPTGGYSGGPGQYAHLATTYAAVMALCILGTQEAYDSIDRKNLLEFFKQCKQPDGSFVMHVGGEVDIRGAYCSAAVAVLTNIMDVELFDKTAEWIVSCQTYEGGFASCRDSEAHGGYSYCGVAALVLLGRQQLCDTKSLLRWLAFKQMKYEGGFQGRTNKLVDGCYSFWQAGIFPLVHHILCQNGDARLSDSSWMYDATALQNYLLICCQNSNGGLIDKPGKNRDYYHTCYTLSGLSIAQHFVNDNDKNRTVGSTTNSLSPTHPVFNITVHAEKKASEYFKRLPTLN
jgi:protein farnesyltransferase subunit beta